MKTRYLTKTLNIHNKKKDQKLQCKTLSVKTFELLSTTYSDQAKNKFVRYCVYIVKQLLPI